jgi:hypothetical protein
VGCICKKAGVPSIMGLEVAVAAIGEAVVLGLGRPCDADTPYTACSRHREKGPA